MLNDTVYVANGIAILSQETKFFIPVALSATDLSCDTIDIDLIQDVGLLFACMRTSYANILAFSGAMEKCLSDLSQFYVNYNIENVNVACFGGISSEVTFNRCNINWRFWKSALWRNNRYCLQTEGVFPKFSELR